MTDKVMDISRIGNSIVGTIAKGSKPLTEDQRLVLIGCLSVWLFKMQEQGRQSMRDDSKQFMESLITKDSAPILKSLCEIIAIKLGEIP